MRTDLQDTVFFMVLTEHGVSVTLTQLSFSRFRL